MNFFLTLAGFALIVIDSTVVELNIDQVCESQSNGRTSSRICRTRRLCYRQNFDSAIYLAKKNPQSSQKMSAGDSPCTSTLPQSDPSPSTALAVVLYDENNVRPHEKPRRTFSLAGREFYIHQNWQSGGVAAVVWDAAIVLAEYLADNASLVKGKKVLELGAGTGLTGMVAATLGADVIVTERSEALPQLQKSIALNQGSEAWSIAAKILDWTDIIDESVWSDFDLVIGADIIYIEDTFPDLLRTIAAVVPDSKTKVLLSCRIRYDRDTKFLQMLKQFFNVEEISYNSELDIKIFSAIRKPKSYR